MKKRLCSVICLILMSFLLMASSVSAAAPRIVVNGAELKMGVQPVIEDGRTLVPLSVITEALSASVSWDEASRTVTIVKDCDELLLTIDATSANKNGSTLSLEVPARILAGRTMVPLSFISQALGASVGWDGETRTVFVFSSNSYYPPT